MGRLRIIIQTIDEVSNECANVNVLSGHDFEMLDLKRLPREEVIDKLEVDTMSKGWEVMRALFIKQLELADKALSGKRKHKQDNCNVSFEGHEPIKIVSRLGVLEPKRQLCVCEECGEHFLPLNKIIPEHKGIIVSKGVREWACLLPQELPFESVARLMGWMSHEEKLISKNTIRNMVKEEGEAIREAENVESEKLSSRDLLDLKPKLVPHENPRRKASWPKEITEEIEKALREKDSTVPDGVSKGDWERVLANKKENTAEELRRLGPKPKGGQVVVSVDEVCVRATEKRKFHDVRTAKVVTSEGYRYFSGLGMPFLLRLYIFILLCGGKSNLVTVLADGATWIRNFYRNTLKELSIKELILDWYHLRKKCSELGSMICRGKAKKAIFLGFIIPQLWVGNWKGVITYLEDYREKAKNLKKLEELIRNIEKNKKSIPNYRERRKSCQYNGSGAVEKANDLLVSKRQKKKGMHWGIDTSHSLADLKTLALNQAWEEYWNTGKILALAA